MKCISKKRKAVYFVLLLFVILLCSSGCGKEEELTEYASDYEAMHYNYSLYKGQLFASELCVADEDILLEGFSGDKSLHASGLFDTKNQSTIYAENLFEELYPASTTKLLTALIVLKYGNLEDVVTVSKNATDFEWDEQVCGLEEGDQITLNDLLNGLILYSGNDTAVAIAEHISGSVDEFAKLMNEEAKKLGATKTHFVNPHGLHHKNHKTTAYDLYLIFNECCKDQRFLDIIAQKKYTGTITNVDGEVRKVQWGVTHYYASEKAKEPEGVYVVGGKTGTTDEAGSCVILLNYDEAGGTYISIIMGASDKTILYDDMSKLLEKGITSTKINN